MVDCINILHLSDIHYSRVNTRASQDLVIDSAFRDIEALCQGPLKPDLIIITGDLVSRADETNTFAQFFDDVIAKLEHCTGCSDRRIFVCPGNHDAHRRFVKETIPLHRKLALELSDREALNKSYSTGAISSLIEKKFGNYLDLRDCLGGKPVYADPIVSVYHVDGLEVDILTMNTAWLTSTGLPELANDERNLLFPEEALLHAQAFLRPECLTVYLTHHPLDWLSREVGNDIEASLSAKVSASDRYVHLFGHLHAANPQAVSTLAGQHLSVQGGALYGGLKFYNGYSLVRISRSTGHSQVVLRSFFEKRRVFDQATDVVDRGVYYSSPEAKIYWSNLPQRICPTVVLEWARTAYLPEIRRDYDRGITDRPIGKVFVPPPMYVKKDVEDAGTPERSTRSSQGPAILLEEIILSTGNFVFHGRAEYGKTTLLQQVALNILETTVNGEQLSIPFYVRFEDIRPGQRPVFRAIQLSLGVELEGFSLNALLESGSVTLLVDDVRYDDDRRLQLISRFMMAYPRNRFIFATTTSDVNSLVGSLGGELLAGMESTVSFENVIMRPFSRRSLRAIVNKWEPKVRLDREAILNRLIRELTSMHLPATAFNSSILLTIYEDYAGFTPINRAVLINRFMEHVLEKRSPTEVYRGTFDFTNKVHVLSDLSEHMARKNEYIIEYTRVLSIVKLYLKGIGLKQDPEELITQFINARILEWRNDNNISFRYRAFIEYFIASQMNIRPEFKTWVLEESRYLSFFNEIRYYAGLNRGERELLKLISARFSRYFEDIDTTVRWNAGTFDLEKYIWPGTDDDEQRLQELEQLIGGPPLSESERDNVLEDELPRDGAVDQDTHRAVAKDVGERWTLSLLLYGGLLKNLEMIPDEDKRRHLGNILEGWAQLTAFSLEVVPVLARAREVTYNGVKYQVIAPRSHTPGRIARRIILGLPNALSKMLMWHVGTEKLELQLVNASGVREEPSAITFYRTSLICDLRLHNWLQHLDGGFKGVAKSRYLREAYLEKASKVYYLGAHKATAKKKLKGMMIEFLTQVRSSGSSDRQGVHDKIAKKVERESQIHKLRVGKVGEDEPIGE